MDAREIQQLRAETKGTAEKIHFNNAGSSLPPDIVVDTVISYLREEALLGGYEAEALRQNEFNNVYTLIAKLINASVDEVAVVENASTAWHMAFNGLSFQRGDEVITSEMEYATNIIGFLNAQKMYSIVTRVIPTDPSGNFPIYALEAAITPRTRLICITHIPSTAGGMMPVVEIGKIARHHGILYLVDACQSAGQVGIDVEEIGADFLAVTGRKYLRAPRGTGFMYVRKEVQDRLRLFFLDGHSILSLSEQHFEIRKDTRRFELYEKNRALMLGLGKAIEYALKIGVDRIWQQIKFLSARLRRQLREVEGVTVHDIGDQQSGIVTFTVRGVDNIQVRDWLASKNINVSVGRAQNTLYFMNRHHLGSIVRASVHYYNTEEELEQLCRAIEEIVSKKF